MRPARVGVAVALALVLALVTLVGAVTGGAGAQVSARVDADLATLHAAYLACRRDQAPCPPSDVLIDAVASGDPGALRDDLAALGMRNIAVAGRIVSGWLPVPAIPRLAGLSTLQFARPSLSATRPGTGNDD